MPDFHTFTKHLGVSFKNPNLLVEALTHRSYLNEHREYTGSHNERLEFLGDAVLELAVTDFLFKKFPANPEGELTAYRAALVNTVSLPRVHRRSASTIIYCFERRVKRYYCARDVILADAFEAIIGAIYLDQGFTVAETFVAKKSFP